jgi:hypothetical protein
MRKQVGASTNSISLSIVDDNLDQYKVEAMI